MITRAVLFERFAGRDEELRHLVELRAKSARDTQGTTVSIVGEAGVGKSRLLSEFEAAALDERGGFIRVRCEELPVPFAPLVKILEQLLERRELRRNDRVAADIGSAIALLTTADTQTTLDAVERKRAIFERVIGALGEAAKRLGQLTLIIDDVHWSDLSTLEALRVLARSVPALPVVLVVTYRPDDLAEDNARAVAVAALERESVDRIALGPLAFGDIAALLRKPIPDANSEVLRRIYDLSEGRPYVAEELARTFVERGSGADFEATISLRSAVLERVGRLASDHRGIIDRAAVLGRNFAPDDLAALGISRDRLLSALRAGLDLQLLEEREVGGAPWFRFRHALTREILYRNMLTIERRSLHLEIAAHLEADGSRAAELAYHLSAAGDGARAATANERAGDDAAGVAAWADAAKLFARALDFSGDPAALARVGLKRAESFARVGDVDAMLATSARDVEKLLDLDRPDDALAILAIAIRTVYMTRLTESVALLELANRLLTPATANGLRFEVELLNTSLLRLQERNVEALAACDRAGACVPQPTSEQRRVLLVARANCLVHLNDLAGALAALEAHAAERADGDERDARPIEALARISHRSGKIRAAFEHSIEAAERWRRNGHLRSSFLQRCNAAFYAAELGDFSFATALAETARRDGTEPGQPLEAALVRIARACGGDPAPHLARFERALESGSPFVIYMFGRDLPYMLESDPKLARSVAVRTLERVPSGQLESDLVAAILEFGTSADIARALAMFEEGGFGDDDILHAADCALVCARVAARENKPIEADRQARVAVELAERMEHWFHLSSALELAGNFDRARAVLERAGAVAELARFDRRRPSKAAAAVARAEAAGPAGKLTTREEQIARLIAAGCSSREAGTRLAITVRTVETHLANVYLKLGIKSRHELGALFAGGVDVTG